MLLLALPFKVSSQIVTSKKEAQKKGLYSYSETPENSASTTTGGSSSEGKPVKTTRKKLKKEKKAEKTEAKITLTENTENDFVSEYTPENYLALQIINNAMEFDGVKYRGGGTSKDGMDCSGLVFTTFKTFDISLPRSSYEQAKVGQVVNLKDIKKGDLLFFNNNRRKNTINHVGLVIEAEGGEIKFIHSTLSLGVVVSSLSEPYYERTFVQANRVLQ